VTAESASRREFLKNATSLVGGSWLAVHGTTLWAAVESAQQARANAAGFIHLDSLESFTLAALTDQIFPPDETPGASELGAVYFIDAALGSFMASNLSLIQNGIADLNQRAGDALDFHELGFDQQTALVKQIESSDFFGAVHFLTLCGLFAPSSYGGNKNNAAWQMIGFESRHVWQHPFGYYDAQYAGEAEHASS